MFSKIFGHGSM